MYHNTSHYYKRNLGGEEMSEQNMPKAIILSFLIALSVYFTFLTLINARMNIIESVLFTSIIFMTMGVMAYFTCIGAKSL